MMTAEALQDFSRTLRGGDYRSGSAFKFAGLNAASKKIGQLGFIARVSSLNGLARNRLRGRDARRLETRIRAAALWLVANQKSHATNMRAANKMAKPAATKSR
jgi:hypothetical protein